MCINHRWAEILVAQKLLDGSYIVTVFSLFPAFVHLFYYILVLCGNGFALDLHGGSNFTVFGIQVNAGVTVDPLTRQNGYQ
jgi:hypothetical protein